MVRAPKLCSLLTFFMLTALLLSGCAGPQAGPQVGSRDPIQSPPKQITTPLDLALAALDSEDYQTAVKQFDKSLNIEGEIPEQYQRSYARALTEVGRYQDAINQLDSYLDNLAQRGSSSYPAELQRRKIDEQRAAAKKSQQIEDNLAQVGGEIETSVQTVQQQIATAPASFIEPLTGMEMVLVKGGCYRMGDQFGDGAADERPVHEVCVDDFYLGRYEVTQEQWTRVMGYNPSKFKLGGSYPVETIYWHEAVKFAEILSGDQISYRLPTEAEWEYAARSGGQKQKYSGGGDPDALAWYIDNSGRQLQPVGQKQPNGLGLHDMSGGVFEWCLDRYAADYYQHSPKHNPTGITEGTLRIRRGGGWGSKQRILRTSFRGKRDQESYRNDSTGFRLALPSR